MRVYEKELLTLRFLALMPFLDRLELSAVSGIPERTAYNVLSNLWKEGLACFVRHASPITASTRRYFLSTEGLVRLAREDGISVGEVVRIYPVSRHWRRILLDRLDAAAVIYRLASALAGVGSLAQFRWYRGYPLDAAVALSDGRTLGIIRQGPTSDATGFSQRVRRLLDSEQRLPSALLAFVPEEVRLRRASRLLAPYPGPVYLALEEDVVNVDSDALAWRLTSGGPAHSLQSAISYVRAGGRLPYETPEPKARLPVDLLVKHNHVGSLEIAASGQGQVHLPLALKPAYKRVLECLSKWPLIASADLGGLLGVSEASMLKLLTHLEKLKVVVRVSINGGRRSALADRGLAFQARRDRVSVSTTLKRWSVDGVKSEPFVSWRDPAGRRTRSLARNMEHTEAVHRFMAMLARQAGETPGCRVIQPDPPHLAARYFRHREKLWSVHPDGFGVLRRRGRDIPFFLEWERRAVRPGTLAAKLAPYLRYYSSRQPLEDHGGLPLVLMVFDDPLVEARFLGVARSELRRARVNVPLWTSTREDLKRHGPLGMAWRNPEVMTYAQALM